MESSLTLVVPVTAFLAASFVIFKLAMRRHGEPLPPGPPGDPFLGHLFRMPKGEPAQAYHEWAKVYGASTRTLALFCLQESEARKLVKNLVRCKDYNDYHAAINRFSTGILSRITTGHEILLPDDPYMTFSNTMLEIFSGTGSPGETPVDLFPILKHLPSWFPGTYYATIARSYQSMAQGILDFSVSYVEEKQRLGEAAPSFVLEHLENIQEGSSQVDIKELKDMTAAFFGAGRATTASTFAVFLLAMVHYPDCLSKAQKEVDAVLQGKLEQLPSFEDREQLPCIEHLMQECLRWFPVVPLGVPHRSIQDDVYRGMFIPKGSIVFSNIRGISLDESVYHKPYEFIPERFLASPEGPGEPKFTDAFGFGRRACPGLYLAQDSLWIAIATFVATCDVHPLLDSMGQPILPKLHLMEGIDAHPTDLRCVIKPRKRGLDMMDI
ncbi:Cytochrome P450 [Mycena chlorophos]|uniref:Cytochrome P450 n=1 Tax=Mycena chlorophos TaxID=658473 RepID=A0A8H6TNS5_MYCCL|nr:Cytochrome P450 [Mycena chlorophos]